MSYLHNINVIFVKMQKKWKIKITHSKLLYDEINLVFV